MALTRTARLQRQARWTLAIIAALVMAGIGLVYWQYVGNLELQASLNNQKNVVASTVRNLDVVFQQINNLNRRVNDDICAGGARRQPSPLRSSLSNDAMAISDNLRGIGSDLERLANGGAVPKCK